MLYLQANEKRVGILLFGVGCLSVPLLRDVFLLSASRLISSETIHGYYSSRIVQGKLSLRSGEKLGNVISWQFEERPAKKKLESVKSIRKHQSERRFSLLKRAKTVGN